MSEDGILGKTEYRMGKPRTITDKPLRQPKPNEPLELTARLKKADSVQAKRIVVGESMPHHYVFGKTLRPWKPYLTYEENMNIPNGERA